MKKYQALQGITKLHVPVVLKDEDGDIKANYSLPFLHGQRIDSRVIPAHFSTKDEELADYLDNYPGNRKNGGWEFEEVIISKDLKPVKDKSTTKVPKADSKKLVKTPDPIEEEEELDQEEGEEQEGSADGDGEEESDQPVEGDGITVFEDVTKNQEAFAILKSMDDSVTTANTRNQKQIHAKAAELNISFPNL